MNKNEECLLLFLKEPDRLDKTIKKLNEFIFFANNTTINMDEKTIRKSCLR